MHVSISVYTSENSASQNMLTLQMVMRISPIGTGLANNGYFSAISWPFKIEVEIYNAKGKLIL